MKMLIIISAWLGLVLTSLSQSKALKSELRINGEKVEAVFEPLRELLQASSAVVYNGSFSVGYAVIMSSDGYLLTKASELEGAEELSVRVGRKKYEVDVLLVDSQWDVALLKVDAKEGELTVLEWAGPGVVEQGSWVISNGATSRSRRRASVGIISANSREIFGAVPVVMGVSLSDEDGEMEVLKVTEGSGAEEAGLQKGDVLLQINGEDVNEHEALQNALRSKEADEVVDLLYRRGDEELEAKIKLRARYKFYRGSRDRNDQMSGRYSVRRDSFPMVLQHDIPLSRRSCGGPLLDLKGRCLGMNIARANRAESYAIPAKELRELAAKMIAESTAGEQKPL